MRSGCPDSTLALPLLLEEHGSIFTPDPLPGNPPKRYSVLKVLHAVYHLDRHLVERPYCQHEQEIETNHHAVHPARYGSHCPDQGIVRMCLRYGGSAVSLEDRSQAGDHPALYPNKEWWFIPRMNHGGFPARPSVTKSKKRAGVYLLTDSPLCNQTPANRRTDCERIRDIERDPKKVGELGYDTMPKTTCRESTPFIWEK
jgi:hypothetical protein